MSNGCMYVPMEGMRRFLPRAKYGHSASGWTEFVASGGCWEAVEAELNPRPERDRAKARGKRADHARRKVEVRHYKQKTSKTTKPEKPPCIGSDIESRGSLKLKTGKPAIAIAACGTVGESKTMASAAKVAVVTGANKGIGYHIVLGLCKQLPAGSKVFLCSRDVGRGEAALASARTEIGAASSVELYLLQLEITDTDSVQAAASKLQQEAPNGIDILVNNAGFAFKAAATEPTPVQARETLRVNFYGTLTTSRAFMPMLRTNARVVNVGSMAGGMNSWGAELRNSFLSPTLTEGQLMDLCEQYVAATKVGTHRDLGWPGTSYGVSKAHVHAMTRIHARDIASYGLKDPTGVTVNAVCPGWCKSDMAGWDRPPKTAAQGADTPLWLCFSGAGGATGKFFSDRSERGW